MGKAWLLQLTHPWMRCQESFEDFITRGKVSCMLPGKGNEQEQQHPGTAGTGRACVSSNAVD